MLPASRADGKAFDPKLALAAASIGIGLASIAWLLDFTRYPYALARQHVFEYYLRTQDVAGSALLLAVVAAALVPALQRPALALVSRLGRNPWPFALAVFVLLAAGTLLVQHNHALTQDDYQALFQSRVFAAGRLAGQYPPDMLDFLIPFNYRDRFVVASSATGQVASNYWPGFSAILAPFSLVGAPWACNPLLAALSLVLIGRLAARLAGAEEAGGWAMLLAAASPQFTASAITYFSMSAHLAANLAFAWLLLDPSPRRLLLAGLVGSVALVLHQPVPHLLFAAPWAVWLALQPGGRRKFLLLAAGYAPLVLVAGFGWALFIRRLQSASLWMAPYPEDGNLLHSLANFVWLWQMKLGWAFRLPHEYLLKLRLAELVRLWAWAAAGLPLLAAAGWWIARRNVPARLLGLSFVCTGLGYLFVVYQQGHGWGARYYHSAWGALPVLGAMVLARKETAPSLRGYVAAAAIGSLLFATALRAWQIREDVGGQLARRPPLLADARQVVFIPFDFHNYTADLVQNDPFLRSPVITLLSQGSLADAELMRRRYPGAKLVVNDRRGQIWQLP